MSSHMVHYQLGALFADIVASGKTITFGKVEMGVFSAFASRYKMQTAVFKGDEYVGEFPVLAFKHALVEYFEEMIVKNHIVFQN